MSKVQMSKHNKGLDNLVARLKDQVDGDCNPIYDHVLKEVDFNNSITGECGQIDVLAIHRNGSYFVFEYKNNDSHRNYEKSKKQLMKAEKYIWWDSNPKRVYQVYVNGQNNFKIINTWRKE